MAEYAKDTPEQAALRERIENHPIWQYPPAERLTHQREWQQLYLLVLEFKKFKQTLENRLRDVDKNAMLRDEDEMQRARYANSGERRTKLDTVSFTIALRNAVAKFDAAPGREFLAYFDAIYVNTLHKEVNKQATRNQGDVALNRREGSLWKNLCILCEKQGVNVKDMPSAFYEKAAAALDTTPETLLRIVQNASTVRTVSLDQPLDEEGSTVFDMADPRQDDIQNRLERTTEAMRTLAMFASKDMKEYPRMFFTDDVLAPMYSGKSGMPPERYCLLLEKQEELLWERLFVLKYLHYLFEPNAPETLRMLLNLTPAHPLQDSSVAAYMNVTAAAVSYQRKKYTALLGKLLQELHKD